MRKCDVVVFAFISFLSEVSGKGWFPVADICGDNTVGRKGAFTRDRQPKDAAYLLKQRWEKR